MNILHLYTKFVLLNGSLKARFCAFFDAVRIWENALTYLAANFLPNFV